MMILEMLNNTQWKRPIYYATSTPPDMQLGLTDKYFRQEGLAYRIVPFDVREANQEVQTDILYDNLMHKFVWGGVENPKIYLDDNTSRMIRAGRQLFVRLASALIMEGKKEKALEVLNHCQQVIPAASVRYIYDGLSIANCYHEAGADDKAIEVYEQSLDYYMKALNWYYRLNDHHFKSIYVDYRRSLETVRMILSFYQQQKPELLEKYMEDYMRYSKR
jgi:tetratricopeptide (TPR) repeat protein